MKKRRAVTNHIGTVHAIAMGDPAAAGEQALDEEALKAVATTTEEIRQ